MHFCLKAGLGEIAAGFVRIIHCNAEEVTW